MRFMHRLYRNNALDARGARQQRRDSEDTMKLYYSPLACSLATRIAFYEAGVDVTYVQVDLRTKRAEDGRDYLSIHPLGLVPVLETDDGRRLTENAAILELVANRSPRARLWPDDAWSGSLLRQWLAFVGTELHKGVFAPLLDKSASAEVKAYAVAQAAPRLDWLGEQLEDRAFLLEHFTVGDAYLFAVLNWTAVTPVNLDAWPGVRRYHQALLQRPSVARAFADERGPYLRELEKERRLATTGR
jgi:glutathione S-transferase